MSIFCFDKKPNLFFNFLFLHSDEVKLLIPKKKVFSSKLQRPLLPVLVEPQFRTKNFKHKGGNEQMMFLLTLLSHH